jgi:hypothetical protein
MMCVVHLKLFRLMRTVPYVRALRETAITGFFYDGITG